MEQTRSVEVAATAQLRQPDRLVKWSVNNLRTQRAYRAKKSSASNDDSRLSPILKWPGGKERELDQIFRFAPAKFKNYFDPFVGGGAVFTAFQAEHFFINDLSEELIGLYKSIATDDRHFFETAHGISIAWGKLSVLSDALFPEALRIYMQCRKKECAILKEKVRHLLSLCEDMILDVASNVGEISFEEDLLDGICQKFSRMSALERRKGLLRRDDLKLNFETALRSSFYVSLRRLYNSGFGKINRQALFFFVRNFAYSGMFRYNARGEFNVPYGGIGYNSKNLKKKLTYYQSDLLRHRLSNTTIENCDFETFLRKYAPKKNDFVFLDPPYDTDFSTYARNEFSEKDQRRLAAYLTKECKAKWMLVIKHTDFIHSLYAKQEGVNIHSFEKKYAVSFMNRNDQNATHLVVRNYD